VRSLNHRAHYDAFARQRFARCSSGATPASAVVVARVEPSNLPPSAALCATPVLMDTSVTLLWYHHCMSRDATTTLNGADAADASVSRLMLRLPGDLHARLHVLADQHDRSLHGEIVAALRQYAEGVTELRYVWSEPPEEVAQAWGELAGATLADDAEEGWEYTPEEEAHLRRSAAGREARRAPR